MIGLMPTSNDPTLPFYDIRVRQAVSHAIDAEAIAEMNSDQGWAYTNQWVPPVLGRTMKKPRVIPMT